MLKKLVTIPAILGLILCDQLSKWWVIEMVLRPRIFAADGPSADFLSWLITMDQTLFPPASIPVTSFFNIVMVWNKGVSFGIFSSTHDIMPYILSAFALAMVIGLSIWLSRSTYRTVTIPLVMIISGAISNVWDRLRFGAVADFLDFYVGDWHYPAFNIADCCIVLGVFALAIDGFFLEPRRHKGDLVTS